MACFKMLALFGETVMSAPVEGLEAQILGLPPEGRARLLQRLIASVESKSKAREAWMQLALRRQTDVRSGDVAMVQGDEALARVRARLA